jgi:phosphatidylglycerophosphate synthase
MHWFKRFLFTLILCLVCGMFALGVLMPPMTPAKLVLLSLGGTLSIPFCWYMRHQLAKRSVPAPTKTQQRSIWLAVVGMAGLGILSNISTRAKDGIMLGLIVLAIAACIAFGYSAYYLARYRPPPT